MDDSISKFSTSLFLILAQVTKKTKETKELVSWQLRLVPLMAVPPADVPALSMESAFDVFRGFFDNTSFAVATRPQLDTTQHDKGAFVDESEEMPPLVQESDTDSNGSQSDHPSLTQPQPKAAVLLPLSRIGTPGTPSAANRRGRSVSADGVPDSQRSIGSILGSLSTRSLNAVGGAFSSRMFLSARQTFRQTLGDTERALGIGTVYHNDKKQVTEQLQGLSLRVAFNQVTQVKSFIALGHNVNEFDVDGDRTPLHWAAARGFRRCVVILLEAGADKTARDAQGRTPAELALDCDQFEIGDIIKYGPPIDDVKKSTGNEGPISQLCLGNKTRELASMLRAYNLEKDPGIRETISVNLRDPDGDRFPLHWAAARGLRTCVNLLIDAGAHIGALDADGNTAAGLAMRFNQRAVHELLLQAIVDVNYQTNVSPKSGATAQLSYVC